MPEHIKALLVILFISSLVWFFVKKATVDIITKEEFQLWRNTWFSITLIAFLSHNFWVFTLLTTGLIFFVSKKEQNKFAFFLVLIAAAPAINSRIPGLFDITYVRILSIVFFLPLLFTFKSTADTPSLGKPTTEKFLLAFMLLSTLLSMRGTTITDAMRYGVYGILDYFLPYFAASRLIKDFEQLKKAMIALVIGVMVAGAIGAYEWRKAWLLYSSLPDALNITWDMGVYLSRGDSLRAMTSLGHALVFGFYMMIGFSFYLFVGKYFKSKKYWVLSIVIIAIGLFSPISRGPWLGAAVAFFTFIAFGPRAVKRFSLTLAAAYLTIKSLYWIPGGWKILILLPFIGNVDKDNLDYRELLIEKSLLVIEKYPFFGVFDAKLLPEMQDLIQGQGIIDVTNSYLTIALGMGLIGLGLFVSFAIMTLFNLRNSMKKIIDKKSDEYLCGRSLMAAMVAAMFTISTVSGIGIIPTLYWSIAGLIFTYTRVIKGNKNVVDIMQLPSYRLKIES